MRIFLFWAIVLGALFAFIGVWVASLPAPSHSSGYAAAKQARQTCLDETGRVLLDLVDKPWRTSEISRAAMQACDDKGIFEPR
jgi:hypothetical protein